MGERSKGWISQPPLLVKALSLSSEMMLWARPSAVAGFVHTFSPFFSFPLKVQGGEGNSSIDITREGTEGV